MPERLREQGAGVVSVVGGTFAVWLGKGERNVQAGAQLPVKGITPYLTSRADFYRIDTALVVPRLTTGDWSLRIHGMVEREVHLTWTQLLALPMVERLVTLSCVSNDVGGDLIGNARWLGHPSKTFWPRRIRPRTPTWCCPRASMGSRRAHRSRRSPTVVTP